MKIYIILFAITLISYFTIFYSIVNTHFNEEMMEELPIPVIEHPTQNINVKKKIQPSLRKKNKDILWVVPVFKRAWTLDILLDTLRGYTVLVSKDSRNNEINQVISKYNVESMEHPWACSIHPNTFPAKDESLNIGYKGDTYGNPRSSWATCLKHHWWWMMNKAWSRNPRQVCVVEDDTIPHPAAFKWLSRHKGNVKLTPNPIAVPWCMDKDTWERIDPQFFCNHDDYNWDQTIAWMFSHKFGPNTATVPSIPLSMHIGDCDGWDAGGRKTTCTNDKIREIKDRLNRWQQLKMTVVSQPKTWLPAHSRPNGGWGHPKDHTHCLQNTLPPIKTVIPTVSKQIVKTLGAIHLDGGNTKFPCDVPCYVSDNPVNIIQDYHIDELDTTITLSMEGEKHWPRIQLQKGKFMGTTRLTSTIPIGYYNWVWTRYLDEEPTGKDKWSQNWIQTPHIPFSDVKKAAVFIARNCKSYSHREKVVTNLMKYMTVDSPSTCLNNIHVAQTNNKINMMKEYALYLAFENEITPDYITEKLWQTFRAGVIPVYYGAPNIKEHLPDPNSIINVADFKDTEALAKHLNKVLNDEELYESYHAWRYKPLPTAFVKKYNFSHVHSKCRICRWAYAKKYNYGWDKEQQEITFATPPQRKCKMLPFPSNVKVKKRKIARDVVQIFPFSHEIDMLRLKIKNTMKFTDEYIIIEGDKTFSLEPKKFYLDDYIDELKRLVSIKRLKLKIKTTNKYSWEVQDEMRLSDKDILTYFPHLDQDSIIVSTDLDEIIKPNILCLLKHYDFDPMPTGVKWRRFVYGFFNEEKSTNIWSSFGTVHETVVGIRGKKKRTWAFQDGGWHCSWCMTVNDIILKLKHSPYVDLPRIADTPKFMNRDVICDLIKAGRWFFNEKKQNKKLSLASHIPHDAPQYMLQPTCTGIMVKEKHHDELSLSVDHRLVKYRKGPALSGNMIKKRLHFLLEHVDTVMKVSKVDYVIAGGTLLGAWRHHGLIPWDTDVDVVITNNSLPILEKYLSTIDNDNIIWIFRTGLHSDIIPIKVVDQNSGYYVDIMICFIKNNICSNRWGVLDKRPYDYPLTDLFPSRACLFDHLEVQCPPNPISILTVEYNSSISTIYEDLSVPKEYTNRNTTQFKNVLWVK